MGTKIKEILARESPLTYVENIKTPFIIFHGGNDRRTDSFKANAFSQP
jgi:dipeptidyl aminopeptidase/acylaminoacyl peptidase